MPPNQATVRVILVASGTTCSITVVPETLDLASFSGAVVQIEWVPDDTQAPGWGFTKRGPGTPGGIEIQNDVHSRFAHNGKAGKNYHWTRNMKDGKTYKYVVNVVHSDGRTATKDPFIVNQ
jgi:hypothetical protein